MQVPTIKAFSAPVFLLALAACIAPGMAGADPRCQATATPKLPEAHQPPPPPAPLVPPATMGETEGDIVLTFAGGGIDLGKGENLYQEAEIDEDGFKLSARKFRFNWDTYDFQASEWVKVETPQLSVEAEGATSEEATGLVFRRAKFDMPAQPARGFAEEIALLRTGHMNLNGVSYTSCPADKPDWELKGKSISLDNQTRNGVGRNLRLEFKGVPIFYTPYISFPLGEERKSGVLTPKFGRSTRGGVELSVPYYFNLAPNLDLTLTPQLMSRRGVGLDQEFRYLTRRQRGTVVGHFLPNDRLRDRDRSLVRWLHQADFADTWRLTIDGANVGDQNYFEDFGLDTEGASTQYLERTVELNRYGRHWDFRAQVQNFQTIDLNIPDALRPYSRLPRLLGRGDWSSPLGFEYSFDSELVYFHRGQDAAALTDYITGARVDVRPEVSWSFTRPGLYITPSLAYRQTQYRLDNVAAGADEEPSRGAPIGSLDAGMVFERTAGRKAHRLQTLEPRLLYLYVPYRDQASLPVFDTGLPDLNLVQLFRRNRYVGADRLSDANQVSFGLTSRLLDAGDGRQLISATLGQTYYFDSPRVTLPGEVPSGRDTSNFISQLTVSAYRDWNINLGHEWNHATSRTEKSEVALQYRPGGDKGGDKVINLGYRFRRDLIEQVDGSVAWPVAKRWNVYARRVYSLRDSALIDQFAGFEYASCCWKLRVVQRRYVSDRTGERDSSIQLQFELKGLAPIGDSIDTFLRRSIRGYSGQPAR